MSISNRVDYLFTERLYLSEDTIAYDFIFLWIHISNRELDSILYAPPPPISSFAYIRTNIYTLWWSDRSEHSRIINYIFLTRLRYKRIRGEWIGGNDREKWSSGHTRISLANWPGWIGALFNERIVVWIELFFGSSLRLTSSVSIDALSWEHGVCSWMEKRPSRFLLIDESQFAFCHWNGKALLGGFVTRAFDCECKIQKNKTHDEKKSWNQKIVFRKEYF